MKHLLLIIVLLNYFESEAQNKSNKFKKAITEKEAVMEVHNLYENRDFLRTANKSEKPTVISDGLIDDNMRYRVKVGYSKFMFRSVAIFDVDIKTGSIYYEDFQDTSGLAEIPLKQWRKWRNDPRFEKSHTIKHGQLIAVKQ